MGFSRLVIAVGAGGVDAGFWGGWWCGLRGCGIGVMRYSRRVWLARSWRRDGSFRYHRGAYGIYKCKGFSRIVEKAVVVCHAPPSTSHPNHLNTQTNTIQVHSIKESKPQPQTLTVPLRPPPPPTQPQHSIPPILSFPPHSHPPCNSQGHQYPSAIQARCHSQGRD